MPDPFNPSQQYATNAPQVTQLPMQYQQGIDASMLKRQLAAMLMQRGMQSPQGQTVVTGDGAPNRFVRSSPWEHLSGLAQTILGGKMMAGAQQELMATANDYQTQHRLAAEDEARAAGPAAYAAMSGKAQPAPLPAIGQTMTPQEGHVITAGDTPPPAIVAPPSGLSSAVQSAYNTYFRHKTSIFPDQQQQSAGLYKIYTDLVSKEAEMEQTKQLELLKAGTAPGSGATYQSKVEAIKGGDVSKLQTIPQIGAGTSTPSSADLPTGERMVQNTGTGELSYNATTGTRQAEEINRAQQESYGKRFEDLTSSMPEMKSVGQTQAQIRAMLDIMNRGPAYVGALSDDKAELGRLSALIGRPIPAGTQYHDLLRMMGTALIPATAQAAKVSSIRGNSELVNLLRLSGQDLQSDPTALKTRLEQLDAGLGSEISFHNRRIEDLADYANHLGRQKDFEYLLNHKITPNMIAPVQTNLPPTPVAGLPPGTPAPQMGAVPPHSHWQKPQASTPQMPMFDPRTGALVPQ